MNIKFAIALVALAALCTFALAQEDDAGAWYRRGLDLIGNNSPQEAVQAYDRAIQIDPSFADAWKAKASALASAGQHQESLQAYDRAIELYDKSINADSNRSEAWYEKGSALRDRAIVMQVMGADSQGQTRYREEAVIAFEKALEIDPQYAEAWQEIGSTLYDLGRFEESLQAFNRAMEIDPDLPGALAGKGMALSALGNEDEADSAYGNVIDKVDGEIGNASSDQELSAAWLAKGYLLQEQGRYEEAVKALDLSTRADPENAMAWKVKGVILSIKLGRHQESLEAFDRAIQIDPDDPEAWIGIGRILRTLGRSKDANDAFARAKGLGYMGPL